MDLLRHIRRCNNFDVRRFRPFYFGDRRIGWVRHDNAEILRRFSSVFRIAPDSVRLISEGDFDAVTAAVDSVVEQLVVENQVPKWRNEFFGVAPRWGDQPFFKLDRGAVSFFGVRAYGVHVNGIRRDSDILKLWIGRRAPDKKVDPDKLDNLVAGGIGYPHGIEDTLIKEADEEAGIPENIARQAKPCGSVSYRMELPEGLRDDVLFLYDLETPADLMPQNRDGEIVDFSLMDAREVVERVDISDDFKFNVNLVIIDFALRYGLVTKDDPEYPELIAGLRVAPI